MDTGIIIPMGLFIRDLHRNIEQLHKNQFGDQKSVKSFIVYRGQGMFKSEFEQLRKNKSGLIAFNTFLSTSKNRDVSVLFAESDVSDPNLVGILFVMNIDSTQSTIPFACITDVSYFEINLTLTNDNDQDLRRLTDRIRAETISDIGGWFRLGLILLKMGEFDKAEQLYQILLEQTNDEGDKSALYNQLGCAKHNQREYDEAIIYYEKAFEIGKKFLP